MQFDDIWFLPKCSEVESLRKGVEGGEREA